MSRRTTTATRARHGVAGLLAVPLVAACLAQAASQPTPVTSPVLTALATSQPTSATQAARAARARMTLAQRVGQLFMVGAPATGGGATTAAQISRYHVGNVMLTGRSAAGVAATRAVSSRLRARVTRTSTAGVGLFVATDQEGGKVQVLRGPGFSTLPTALRQGTWRPRTVRANARLVATQLRAAGVNMDLGPVLDTVPGAAFAPKNAPIGYYHREFGYTPYRVSTRGVAFAQGLADRRVAAAVKHFPGLGRVTANTDTRSHVVDRMTMRHDAYVAPFATAVRAGVPFVMVSSATYRQIDARRPAVFSPIVLRTMLRRDLQFDGVIISDDLANARQVAAWSPASRAVTFIGAGGDMVLIVSPSRLPEMYRAVLARARTNATFRRQVDAAVLRVLTAKASLGVRVTP